MMPSNYSYAITLTSRHPMIIRSLLIVCLYVGFTCSSGAATINLKLVGSGAATSTTTNPGYGLWGQGTETWNVNNSYSGTNLVDSTGAASGKFWSVS